MKQLVLIALLASLCGCGATVETTPQWHASVSQDFTGPFFTLEQVDASITHVYDELVNRGFPAGKLAAVAESAIVVTYAHDWPCPTEDLPDRHCSGQQKESVLSVAVGLEDTYGNVAPMCVWDTALMHEFLHLFLDRIIWDADPDHLHAELWPMTGVRLGSCGDHE